MKIPRGIVKVADLFRGEGVANNWLDAVGTGVGQYVNGPCVSAYQSVPQTIATTNGSTLIVDTTTGTPIGYNSSTGVFTASVRGYYRIDVTVGIANPSSITMYINNNGWYISKTASANSISLVATQLLNVGDTLKFIIAHTNASATPTNDPRDGGGIVRSPYTWLSIMFARPA